MACFKFRSEKVVAFCRLAISSNCGCRHVPETGVAGEAGFDAGVAGVACIDISVSRQTQYQGNVTLLED